MKNEAFEYLKQHIGKEVSTSPSPFMNWLKPTMLAVEEGRLSFQYTIRHEMTNPYKTLHGGIVAAMIDDAIGATLICYGEPYFYPTINNVIDYFASARENDIIIAETSIIKKGNQIVNAQCEIWNNDKSKLLAKGYTNLLKTGMK
ncbi:MULTISPECIES: PaaI family thioesterase [Flavobacterium]|uniref:PaaI family thioesterase n=1 Tax=Flavobacterium TaxID=237 RepID=UPI00086EB2B6|nr:MULTISPECIES: PaaI family thioesterase [Flavobacterium]ODS84031.1 MAG: thioesterase [Chryseobacterium sp. SCN 40-13]OJV72350.1 MAG: thioesterase [Flavobacterium sp. 40-81]